MHKLAFLPLAAIADSRLSRNDLAVLAVLCEFYRHKKAGKRHPTREFIRATAGIRDERQVSKATSRLVETGWISKLGAGGRSGAASYVINWLNPAFFDRVSNGNNPVLLSRVLDGLNPVVSDRVLDASNPAEFDRDKGNPAGNNRVAPNPAQKDTHINQGKEEEKYQEQLSESVERARGPNRTGFGLGDVIEMLVRHGMPEAFVNNDADRQMMLSWSRVYSLQQIQEACEKGSAAKLAGNDTSPLGPRYVNKILENSNGGKTASDRAGDAWLAGQRKSAA